MHRLKLDIHVTGSQLNGTEIKRSHARSEVLGSRPMYGIVHEYCREVPVFLGFQWCSNIDQ